MAAIFKNLKFVPQLANRNPALVCLSVRNHWNKDFKPAPFPQTKEEREAAAKKYNLLPEEYKPYADDGYGYGDYPQLPNIGTEMKDPYYPYDFPELRRNFQEPLHVDADLYGEDRYSYAEPPRYANSTYFLAFFGVMTGCFALYFWLEDKKMFRPVLPKQLPAAGRKHYTFEPKE